MPTREQIHGCLLGLSLGDALGAPFEGGLLERLLWRMIGTTRNGDMRWTDDTQMTIDLLESYLDKQRIDQDDLASRFSRSYRWSRGYGPGAARTLKLIAAGVHWQEANRSVYRQGSFGNGGAMRSPVIGLIYSDRPDELTTAAHQSAIVTHAHPQAIEGTILVAHATAAVINGIRNLDVLERLLALTSIEEFQSRLKVAKEWLASGRLVAKSELVRQLGNGIAAKDSCATAIYAALRFRDESFVDMHQFIHSCGGDTDTIGAMAGALWGAANGDSALPESALQKLEQRDRLTSLAQKLHQRLAENTQ